MFVQAKIGYELGISVRGKLVSMTKKLILTT